MAKTENYFLLSYKSLLERLQKETIPGNILIALKEKVLIDDVVKLICEKFVGKTYKTKNNLISFSGDDKIIGNILNECSNTGLFSEKKVVVLRNVKKLLKDEKLALLEYFKRSNPDTCLVMISSDDEFNPGKIFLYDSKDDPDRVQEKKNNIEKNVKIFEIEEFSEQDTIKWVKEKFDPYKIEEETIEQFLQFSNYSFDEILSEIEKLKTYCYRTMEITKDSINLCNGVSKDFNEFDFIKAVLERKNEKALMIYDRISLKKDVEVYLVFLCASAFTVINKLYDPAVSGLNGWQLKKELKLWFPDQEKLLPFYRSYRDSADSGKISMAFSYIYQTDKMLKTSAGDKRTTLLTLINNICSL